MCAGTLQDNPKCTALVSKPTDKYALWIRWSSFLPRISCEGSFMIIPPTVKKFPAFIWCKTSPPLSQKLPTKPLRSQPIPLHNPLSYCVIINSDAMAYQSWKPCGLMSCLCQGYPALVSHRPIYPVWNFSYVPQTLSVNCWHISN